MFRPRVLAGRAILVLLAVACAPALAQLAVPADDPCAVIREIEVRGNQRMSADAVRFDLAIKPGDRWDERAVAREFRRFWNRGYFSDLRFSRRCTEQGAVLVVELEERPTILSVSYEKSKIANQQQIEDFFKERNFTLAIGSPLDRKRIWRAESHIKELLGTKGYLDARVHADVKEVSPGSRSVYFRIQPGGKTRIRDLEFTGNHAFRDSTLRRQLKLMRPWRFYMPWGRKTLYHPLKYQQDINNVLQFYRDRGYLDVDARPPVVEVKAIRDEKAEQREARKAQKRAARAERKAAKERERAGEDPNALLGKAAEAEPANAEPPLHERKWVYITIPLEEGPVYKLGEVTFSGNTVFDSEHLRVWIPLAKGDVVSDGALEAGVSRITALYGQKGYVYAAVTRRFERHEGEPVTDVVFEIDEDQAYSVRRIEFSGNTSTNDEVLRRELNVFEGKLLDRTQLDVSMSKLQQLGFWVPTGEPALEPVPEREQVDVKVAGEEQSRNEVQVGGGYSELEGGFFLASYQTRNFLGRGESLSAYLAFGGRSNQASLSFVERWFLGRPYTFGISLYRRSLDFGAGTDITGARQDLNQTSTGGSITLGKRIRNFSQIQLTYGYESVESDTFDLSQQFDAVSTRIATLTPVFSYNQVNNYLRPTRGLTFTFTPQVAGEFFGGDSNFFRPRVEASIYRPLSPRLFVALHGEVGWIQQFGNMVRDPGYIQGVPRFQRFFLGGDTIGPRAFETRSISPFRYLVQTDNGELVSSPFAAYVGGSKMGLVQFELGVPIGRTATMAAFFDAGGVYDDGQDFSWEQARASSGLEFRVFLPVFQAPIRLIYGWPVKEIDCGKERAAGRACAPDRTTRFQFSIGLPF
ncbi:MAG: outer membrane protein assembly factor BamA [Acidobacteria bacterium]|nr:outer membrane protein assembly factor BamA [Acidobacteriota bacterium]